MVLLWQKQSNGQRKNKSLEIRVCFQTQKTPWLCQTAVLPRHPPIHPCLCKGPSPLSPAAEGIREPHWRPRLAILGSLCKKYGLKMKAPLSPQQEPRQPISCEPSGKKTKAMPPVRMRFLHLRRLGEHEFCLFYTQIWSISDLTQIQLKHWQQELEKCMNMLPVVHCRGQGWMKRNKDNCFYSDTQVRKTLFSQQ